MIFTMDSDFWMPLYRYLNVKIKLLVLDKKRNIVSIVETRHSHHDMIMHLYAMMYTHQITLRHFVVVWPTKDHSHAQFQSRVSGMNGLLVTTKSPKEMVQILQWTIHSND